MSRSALEYRRREVLKLHALGLKQTAIAAQLRCNQGRVSEILSAARGVGQ